MAKHCPHLLGSDSSDSDEDSHQPCADHLAFIPKKLTGNVITLKSEELNKERIGTVFLGIITPEYDQSMWDLDVQRWKNEFDLPNTTQYCIEVKMQNLNLSDGKPTKKVDAASAIVEIETALTVINKAALGATIRVIFLGPGVSQLTLDALMYLVREWKAPNDETRNDKNIQVVTTGVLVQRNLFDLCKKLCLAGICQTIQFYDTMQYYPFGHYRRSFFLE